MDSTRAHLVNMAQQQKPKMRFIEGKHDVDRNWNEWTVQIRNTY